MKGLGSAKVEFGTMQLGYVNEDEDDDPGEQSASVSGRRHRLASFDPEKRESSSRVRLALTHDDLNSKAARQQRRKREEEK
ncbi:hypothetical protein Ct61P_02776 [Colletotrichum tofieldiae]|nr:hypothetical protein Ct61P_02776 [Colletotrichum tofieldiae]